MSVSTMRELLALIENKSRDMGMVDRETLRENLRLLLEDPDHPMVNENLRKWFKEKWVRFGPDGKIRGACARGDDSEGKPKCLPQSKAHSLGKKGRKYAASKKRREDPNAERKGKAINVATKKKTNEGAFDDPSPMTKEIIFRDKIQSLKNLIAIAKEKGRGLRVQELELELNKLQDKLDEACWKGYHKEGMKTMFGKRYPNCVKNKKRKSNESVIAGKQPGQAVVDSILKVMPLAKQIWFHGSRATGRHRRNSDTDILVVLPDNIVGDQYLDAVRILQKLNLAFDNYDIQPTKSDTNIHRIAQEEGKLLWSKQGVSENREFDLPPQEIIVQWFTGQLDKVNNFRPGFTDPIIAKLSSTDKPDLPKKVKIMILDYIKNNPDKTSDNKWFVAQRDLQRSLKQSMTEGQLDEKWSKKYKRSIDCDNPKGFSQRAHCQGRKKNESVEESHSCPHCGGPMYSEEMLNEKRDACYYKVKSRYKVWPSAYASGALVKCRKMGASKWGSKGK